MTDMLFCLLAHKNFDKLVWKIHSTLFIATITFSELVLNKSHTNLGLKNVRFHPPEANICVLLSHFIVTVSKHEIQIVRGYPETLWPYVRNI